MGAIELIKMVINTQLFKAFNKDARSILDVVLVATSNVDIE
jgi:hypothetical protein